MKNLLLGILLIALVGELVTLYIMHRPKTQEKVLAEATIASPSSSILLSPTSTPTPKPTATPKPKLAPTKTPTPVPVPTASSQQINGFIDRFSGQYGVDPNVIRHIAICESGFNPGAINGSYVGLFQFGATTWKNLRAEIGEDSSINLRANAEEATQTAAYAVSKGKRGIWPNCNP